MSQQFPRALTRMSELAARAHDRLAQDTALRDTDPAQYAALQAECGFALGLAYAHVPGDDTWVARATRILSAYLDGSPDGTGSTDPIGAGALPHTVLSVIRVPGEDGRDGDLYLLPPAGLPVLQAVTHVEEAIAEQTRRGSDDLLGNLLNRGFRCPNVYTTHGRW